MTDPNVPESRGQIIVFGARQIRRAWVDGEWYEAWEREIDERVVELYGL